MDPLALGAGAAFAAATLFGSLHALQGGSRRNAAHMRLRELRRPFDTGTESEAAIPWRNAPTSVPILALVFARGTRGAEMEEALRQAGLSVRPGAFLLMQALCAVIFAIVALLVGGTSVVGLLLAVPLSVLGWFVPRVYLTYRTVHRLQELDRQLVDLLSLLASSVRAGFSILQGLDSAAGRVGAPLQIEVERVLADVRLGKPMEGALREWSQRVPSVNLRLLVTAMIVQRSAGGNLAEVLDNLAQTMRERVELKHQVNALTAYPRLSARIVGAFPFVMAIVLTGMNPDVYGRLWTEPAGFALLGAALTLNAIAFVVLRRVARVEY